MDKPTRGQAARIIGYAGGDVSEETFQERVQSMIIQNLLAGKRVDARAVINGLHVKSRSLGAARRIALEEIAQVYTQRMGDWFGSEPDVQRHVRRQPTRNAQASVLRAVATTRRYEFPGVDLEVVRWV